MTLCDDGTSRRWPMLQPVAGDPALVKLWVQTITGEQQDAGKAARCLTPPPRREQCATGHGQPAGGGPRTSLGAGLDWHDGMAGAFEVTGPPEAALPTSTGCRRPVPRTGRCTLGGPAYCTAAPAMPRPGLSSTGPVNWAGSNPCAAGCSERAENLDACTGTRRRSGFSTRLSPPTRRTLNPTTQSATAKCAWAVSLKPATTSRGPWRGPIASATSATWQWPSGPGRPARLPECLCAV